MKKLLDKLLEIFIVLFTIFLYSIALKILLGIIWMLGGVYLWFSDLHWAVQVGSSIIVGLCLIRWRDRDVWNRVCFKNGK